MAVYRDPTFGGVPVVAAQLKPSTGTSITTATFSGSDGVWVTARVFWGASTTVGTPTLAWSGSAPSGNGGWSQIEGTAWTDDTTVWIGIFRCWCPSAFSGASVTLTRGAGTDASDALLVVDAWSGASSDQSLAVSAHHAGAIASTITSDVTLTKTAGSHLICLISNDSNIPAGPRLAPRSDSTPEGGSAYQDDHAGVGVTDTAYFTDDSAFGSQTVGFTDNNAVTLGVAMELLTAAGGTESVTTSDSFTLQTQDSTGLQTSAFQSSAFQEYGGTTGPSLPTFSDSATATDSFAPNKVATATVSESATASDTVGINKAATFTESESVTATDSVAVNKIATVTFSDSATATDSFAALQNPIFTDTAIATDSAALAMVATATLSESVTASDAVALQVGSGTQPTFSDSVTATDAFEVALVAAMTFSESATASDSAVPNKVIEASIPESVSATDAFALKCVMGIGFVESASALDSFDNGAGPAPTPPTTWRPPRFRSGTFIPWWKRARMRRMRSGR